jgi:Protein of unknown function (DUF2950)
MMRKTALALAPALALALALGACSRSTPHRTFATPEDAVRALTAAVKAGDTSEVIAIFGPDGQALIDTADPANARRNRDIFAAAVAERWHIEPGTGGGRVLVIGNENWPFPVPIVQDGGQWRFDTAAGAEEVLARRIGRNELAAIFICRAYVRAQQLYALHPHDGQPAGRYAVKFQSDPGQHNGLYWPTALGEKRSPLGDLVARAAAEGRPLGQGPGPTPFHGYYFRILPADGGFGLVAWPADYDRTGVMSFVVNQDGTVREKDLGPATDNAVHAMTAYGPDASWTPAIAAGGA